MASTYSTNLALELIGTGEQSGTWGTTTNTNLGTLLEQAISGYVTQAITDGADTTITIPNGTTGVARNMFIECTGALTAGRNLIVPANKKLYFIYNNTTGGFAVTVKVSGQTGVSVANGKKVLLVSNGTDIVLATNSFSGAFDGTVGATTPSTGAFTTLSATTSMTVASISITPAEGTWTPTDASGASLSFSGVYALGKYKKVGAIVWFSFQVLYPATASAAAATIGGLPFTPANTGPDNVTGAMQTNGSTAALLTVNSGAANIALQIASTGVQFTNVQLSTIFVRGSGFYFTT